LKLLNLDIYRTVALDHWRVTTTNVGLWVFTLLSLAIVVNKDL